MTHPDPGVLDRLPAGEVLDCPTPPKLTPAHLKRLRGLWAYGRPVHVGTLGGIDLDLIVLGLAATVDTLTSASAVLGVTRRGVVKLNEARQALVTAQQAHHDLGGRLAEHLRGKGLWTWENVEFANPDRSAAREWGVVRPDVFACLPVLQAGSAAPAIYEVKVSRADFLADLSRPAKRAAYAALAEAVYYCCEGDLIAKTEVPDGFGLLSEVVPGQFEIRKKARRARGFRLDANTAMTLMVKRQVPLAEEG